MAGRICEICGNTLRDGKWGLWCANSKRADHKGYRPGKSFIQTVAPADYTGMRWTEEQTAIRSAILSGDSSIEVNATAGAGKSTLLAGVVIDLYKINPTAKVLVVAFGSRDKEDMRGKLSNTSAEVHSYNSFGLKLLKTYFGRSVKDWKPNKNKSYELLQNAIGDATLARGETGSIRKCVEMLRQNLLMPTKANIEDVLAQYDIEQISELGANYIPTLFNQSVNLDLVFSYGLDYADQWHLPVFHSMPAPTYDYILIDESQDINLANRRLVFSAIGANTKVVYVGDRNQAIYAWRGASANSMDEIKTDLEKIGHKVNSLPMRETRRVPVLGCDMINSFMGDNTINPCAGMIDGKLVKQSQKIFYDETLPTLESCLVICRTNAPLISGCLLMLSRKLPACIRGKDLGYELLNVVDRVGGSNIEEFLVKLNVWLGESLARCQAMGIKGAQRAQVVQDKYECLTVLADHAESIADLKANINYLFDDQRKDTIVFSTVHKAKGDECKTVALLGSPSNRANNIFDSMWGTSESAGKDRINTLFVALTRFKETLYFVDTLPKDVIGLAELSETEEG